MLWKEGSGVDSEAKAGGRNITHAEGDQPPN